MGRLRCSLRSLAFVFALPVLASASSKLTRSCTKGLLLVCSKIKTCWDCYAFKHQPLLNENGERFTARDNVPYDVRASPQRNPAVTQLRTRYNSPQAFRFEYNAFKLYRTVKRFCATKRAESASLRCVVDIVNSTKSLDNSRRPSSSAKIV